MNKVKFYLLLTLVLSIFILESCQRITSNYTDVPPIVFYILGLGIVILIIGVILLGTNNDED